MPRTKNVRHGKNFPRNEFSVSKPEISSGKVFFESGKFERRFGFGSSKKNSDKFADIFSLLQSVENSPEEIRRMKKKLDRGEIFRFSK